jgi:hypothetical protein
LPQIIRLRLLELFSSVLCVAAACSLHSRE